MPKNNNRKRPKARSKAPKGPKKAPGGRNKAKGPSGPKTGSRPSKARPDPKKARSRTGRRRPPARKKAPGRSSGTSRPPRPGRARATAPSRGVFHAFCRIIDGIYENEPADEIGKRALDTALDLLGCDLGMIGEINPEGNLDAIAIAGNVWSGRSVDTVRPDEVLDFFKDLPVTGAFQKVISEGRSVLENDITSRLEVLPQLYEDLVKIKEVIAVPYLVMGRILGIFVVANKAGGFTSEDLEMLSELANLISMARSKMMALNTAIRNTADGIVLVDRNGVLSMVNPAMEKMFGYSSSEIEGRSLLGLFLDPKDGSPKGEAIAGAVMEGHWSGDVIGLKRDGTSFPVLLSLITIDEVSSPKTGFMAIVRDMTAERQARSMAELYLETADVMLLALDLEGRVTMINRKGEAILGRSRDDILGKDWFDNFVSEKDRPKARRIFEIHVETGMASVPDINDLYSTGRVHDRPLGGHVYSVLDDRGNERTIHCNHSYLRNQHGLAVGILSSGNDITDQRTAEERYRSSEDLYKTLVMTLPDAVVVSDLDGVITEVSDRAIELYGGSSHQDLLGKLSFELLTPECRETALEAMSRSLTEGHVDGLVYTFYRKDGSTYIGQMNASLIKDPDGKPKSFIATIRDVTAQKEAEKRLHEAEAKYRSLFETSPAGIVRFGLGTRSILMANDRFAHSLGYDGPEDLMANCDVSNLYSDEDRERVMAVIMKQGYINDYELELTKKDGSKMYAMINATVNLEGRYADFTGIDITDMKNVRRQKEEAEEQLRTMFETLPVGIVRIRVQDGKFVDANRRAAKNLGFDSKEELMTKITARELLPPALLQDLFTRVMKDGFVRDLEIRPTRPDGTQMITLVNARYDPSTDIMDFSGIEITDIVRTKERLAEAEESYRRMFSASSAGMVRIRLSDGRAMYANEAFARMVGFSSVDHVQRVFKVSNHIKDIKIWNEMVGRFLDGLGPIAPSTGKTNSLLVGFIPNTDLRVIKADGSSISVVISGCIYLETGLVDLTVIDTTILKNRK